MNQIDAAIRWNIETDVVVVGYGGAGATAAITAHDAGAKVLLLEKMLEGGGNTAISGGGFIVPISETEAFEYLSKTFEFAKNEMDAELVRLFCQRAVKTKEFLSSLNPNAKFAVWGYANYKDLPNANTIIKYVVQGDETGGKNLFTLLHKAVQDRRIETRYQTQVTELLGRGNEVVGVRAQCEGKIINIKARKGVVLACGGYEYNQEMMQNFCLGKEILGLGNPGNTGDGLRMAQSAGAMLWHMTSYSCPLGIKIPGYQSACLLHMMTPGYIWVNQQGKRFVNEAGLDFHSGLYAVNNFDPVTHNYPAIPCYLIMDERARVSGPITHKKFGYLSLGEGYNWSNDFSKEIEAGIVKKANTIKDLAKMIGVPSENLIATVNRWNKNMSKGLDPDFNRPHYKPVQTNATMMLGFTTPTKKLSETIEVGPFYAIELYPAVLNTQGGPRRNVDSQVIDADGKAIPRLFVAGELGSIWGTVYQGSSNVSEALIFGTVAGQTVSKLNNWS